MPACARGVHGPGGDARVFVYRPVNCRIAAPVQRKTVIGDVYFTGNLAIRYFSVSKKLLQALHRKSVNAIMVTLRVGVSHDHGAVRKIELLGLR